MSPFSLSWLRNLVLVFALITTGVSQATAQAPPSKPAPATKTVYLVDGVNGENLLTVTTAIAAGAPDAVVLVHDAKAEKSNRDFLAAYKPDRVIPVGSFADGISAERLGVAELAKPVLWSRGEPTALWDSLFSQADQVVVTPSRPYRLRLQAACLAATLRAPLAVADQESDGEALLRRCRQWKTKTLFLSGKSANIVPVPKEMAAIKLADEAAIQAACLQTLEKRGPVHNLVVTNPADLERGTGLSALSPAIAAQRRALLLLTQADGKDTNALVQGLQERQASLQADTLVIVAGLNDIPPERRPNPAAGKDVDIEMEPLTPSDDDLFTFAVGRLFHRTPALLASSLARQRLVGLYSERPRALVTSNPGGSLPLLELFSRNTAAELQNAGYQTTCLFGKDVDADRVREAMARADIFLWEGHYKTLMDDYGFADWKEPLPSSLVFLQSCLALNEAEAQPLFDRGAIAVVGSSTRTYSASGGAFSLAYFDALLYDEQTLGGALRQAKNFMLLYAHLKQRRLDNNAKLAGANRRSAWAFTLWGDPTLKLPTPARSEGARPAVRASVKDRHVTITLPEERLRSVRVKDYETTIWPNSRLAGLVRPRKETAGGTLAPLVFAELHLSDARAGREPVLHAKYARNRWVTGWDASRKTAYILIVPPKEVDKLTFRISWRHRD